MATSENDGDKPARASLPVLYKDLQPVTLEHHGKTFVVARAGYRHARGVHAVPLQAQEFIQAARCFPIVFSKGDLPMPIAVLGIKDDQNLFVDEAGEWAPGCYIPAYVRRYPFASARREDSNDLILLVDASSDAITEDGTAAGAQALFEDGLPSAGTKAARDFCFAYEQQAAATRGFVTTAAKQDLLTAKDVTCQLPSGRNHGFTGWTGFDEEKFKALADDVFLEWRRQGWLPLVHWHLMSLGHFASLFHRQDAMTKGA
jgi:hypothetical protein